MIASSALCSRIDHQSQTSGRCRLSPPGWSQEELLANQERRKAFLRPRDPVHVNNSLRHTELGSRFRVLEECVDESVAFGDAERSCLPQSQRQKLVIICQSD